MRILIPLAARSKFFPAAEFPLTLPNIGINGSPIINLVIENLSTINPDIEFIFVVLSEECRAFSLDSIFQLATNNRCQTIELRKQTKGSLCSCLMAIDCFNDERPLIITTADQIFDLDDLSKVIENFQNRGLDAGVISFETIHPRWSYIRVEEERILEAAPPGKVISRNAIAGFLYFARGKDYAAAAMESVYYGAETNGYYHNAPALNQLILKGMKLGQYKIPSDFYHSFHSPQKIADYERLLQTKALNFLPKIKSYSLANIPEAKTDPPVTVVIPMAGMGSRFVKQGYQKPKPFIDVLGKTMIEQVMDNLSLPNAKYILLARRQHLEQEPEIVSKLQQKEKIKILPVEKLTEGTACTVLLARQEIDEEASLLIANCDQLVDFNCYDFIQDCWQRNLDGSILAFRDAELNPKWSFARTDEQGIVLEVKEKVPISDLATVGIYLFTKGKDFITAALDMIVQNERVNNEFYTCPVYNYAIKNGKKIGVFEVAPEAMHGLGTPEDLNSYLQNFQAHI